MSTATQPTEQDRDRLYDCNYCEVKYDPRDEFRPGFCSAICEASDRAESVMNILHHDHRYCSTCFRKIRNVYPPTRSHDSKHIAAHEEWGPEDDPYAFFRDEIPDCAIGRAFPLPHCLSSSNAEVFRQSPDMSWGFEPHPVLWKNRAVCSCGAMHHKTIIPELRARHLDNRGPYVWQLSQAIRTLLHEDKHGHTHDPSVLARELEECYLDLDEEFQQKQIIRCLGHAIVATT